MRLQTEPPCYWFGALCPCSRYIIMASAIGVFTFIYLLASIAITLGEKKLSERKLVAGLTCAPTTPLHINIDLFVYAHTSRSITTRVCNRTGLDVPPALENVHPAVDHGGA